ncbi:hypothetical protein LshimejAT787_2200100 [Lyophyllum shimeji]|uniref:Uncharacterized protein n=1 Tax=Lyophyllum shimeji TaxID=47721 RepID=A0A9P3Q1Z9_LYOSH|nr:hypothetical protein LshimejAT787_2200100 [Lyophyllum shimeji]
MTTLEVNLDIQFTLYEEALNHASREETQDRIAPMWNVQRGTVKTGTNAQRGHAQRSKGKRKASALEFDSHDDILIVATKGIDRPSTPPNTSSSRAGVDANEVFREC